VNPGQGARSLIEAFSAADFEANEGAACRRPARPRHQRGRARFALSVTQIVAPRPEQVMVMAEVQASRGRRSLHNHAAHLLSVRDGRIGEWWMVEALPADSDAFWSAE
jgi:ketosteroid isomerase-like protein